MCFSRSADASAQIAESRCLPCELSINTKLGESYANAMYATLNENRMRVCLMELVKRYTQSALGELYRYTLYCALFREPSCLQIYFIHFQRPTTDTAIHNSSIFVHAYQWTSQRIFIWDMPIEHVGFFAESLFFPLRRFSLSHRNGNSFIRIMINVWVNVKLFTYAILAYKCAPIKYCVSLCACVV